MNRAQRAGATVGLAVVLMAVTVVTGDSRWALTAVVLFVLVNIAAAVALIRERWS